MNSVQPRCIALSDQNCFFAAIEQRDFPELRGQRSALPHIRAITPETVSDSVVMDAASRRNRAARSLRLLDSCKRLSLRATLH